MHETVVPDRLATWQSKGKLAGHLVTWVRIVAHVDETSHGSDAHGRCGSGIVYGATAARMHAFPRRLP